MHTDKQTGTTRAKEIAIKCATLDPMTSKSDKKSDDDPASRRTERGLLGVGVLTERVARPILGKRGFASGQVIGRWREIVGADLASATVPEKIQFERGERRGGTLHLRVASGAAAVLIQPQSRAIVDRVNAYLGAGTIAHIRVNQGPLNLPQGSKSAQPTAPISDRDLENARLDVGEVGSDEVCASLAKLGGRLKALK